MRTTDLLPYLRAFEATARLGHVGAAATELNVTPGAISQQLRKLQNVLGVALFARHGRTLKLTEPGQRLRRSATSILEELGACVRTIEPEASLGEPRHMTLAVPPGIGVSWLTPVIFDFSEKVGLSSFRLLPLTDMRAVDWRVTDVAIVYGHPPWEGCWWELIGTVELSPVCSPRLLNGPMPLRKASDVVDYCLLHEDEGREWRRWLEVERVRRIINRQAYFGSVMFAVAAALEGRGLALVSEYLAQDYLRLGRLVRPFETEIFASGSYYVVSPTVRSQDPLILSFAEWMVERAERVRSGVI